MKTTAFATMLLSLTLAEGIVALLHLQMITMVLMIAIQKKAPIIL